MNKYTEEEKATMRKNLLDLAEAGSSILSWGKVDRVAISMMTMPIGGNTMGYQMIIFAPTIQSGIDSVNKTQIFGGSHAPLQIDESVSPEATSIIFDYLDVLRVIVTTQAEWKVSRGSAEVILTRENITLLA